MAKYSGVYISNEFLKNEAANLPTAQLGLIVKMFDLMSSNDSSETWGCLVDKGGKPLSERKVRYYCGDGSIVSHATWDKAKKAFYDIGILENMRAGKYEYVYSRIFVEMNPFTGERKEPVEIEDDKAKSERALEHTTETFLGYDPSDARPENELDTWGKICRVWIEQTTDMEGYRPPFPTTWHVEAKQSAKTRLIAQAEQIGVEQSIRDIRETFEKKGLNGREIATLTYFSARWLTKDWKQRTVGTPMPPPKPKHEPLREEIKVLAKRGMIKSLEDIYKRYPLVSKELLNDYARGLFK